MNWYRFSMMTIPSLLPLELWLVLPLRYATNRNPPLAIIKFHLYSFFYLAVSGNFEIPFQVFEGDGLPNKICHPCKYQLEKSYSFRKKCENSDLKLRQHLKMLQEKIGQVSEDESFEETSEEQQQEQQEQQEAEIECKSNIEEEQPSTEEDLVGVTQVAYIQPTTDNNEGEEEAENITLPADAELINKEACTLPVLPKKELIDIDPNDTSGVFVVEEDPMMETDNTIDESDYNAIANAVKATLASQPGINVHGELHMKVNQQVGKMTQVEVTTEDGSVILIELMTEDDSEPVETERINDVIIF